MRPVDKGEAPDKEFKKYQEAEQSIKRQKQEGEMKYPGQIYCFPVNIVILVKGQLWKKAINKSTFGQTRMTRFTLFHMIRKFQNSMRDIYKVRGGD